MTVKTYPVGGFAPGFYRCACIACGARYDGAKHSWQCEPCGTKEQEVQNQRLAAMAAEYGPFIETRQITLQSV